MDLPTHQVPPKWLTEPLRFSDSLEHSLYFSDDFHSMVQVEDSNKFAGGLRSFMYWRRQLVPSLTALTVMFSLIGATGLLPLNVLNVMSGALRVYCLKRAVEFSQGANSQFLAISFKSEADAIGFRKAFKYFGEAVIGYVKPASSEAVRYSLLWLPPLFAVDNVQGLLRRYCTDFTIVKGSISIGEGQYMPSSVVRGSLTLKPGIDVEELPHLIPLPSPHLGYALLIIDGRQPFCLKCLKKGHLRKHCTRPKCRQCHFYHSPSDVCDHSSYAAKVLRSPGAVQSYCWMDDVSAPEDTGGDSVEAPVEEAVIVNSSIPITISETPVGVTAAESEASLDARPIVEGPTLISIASTLVTGAAGLRVETDAPEDGGLASSVLIETVCSPASLVLASLSDARVVNETSDWAELGSLDGLSDVSVVLEGGLMEDMAIGEHYSDSSSEDNLLKSSPVSGGGGKRFKMGSTSSVDVDVISPSGDVADHNIHRSAETQDVAEAANQFGRRSKRKKHAMSVASSEAT